MGKKSEHKKKNKEKKYHFEYLHVTEAEREAKAVNVESQGSDKKIQNDIISQKAAQIRESYKREQKQINKDVRFSLVLTGCFLVIIGALYYVNLQNDFMTSLSVNLMDFLLQK